jgi:hypothetical protein
MALFKPIKKTLAEIENISVREGQFLFATDTGYAFVDIDNENRVQLRCASGAASRAYSLAYNEAYN